MLLACKIPACRQHIVFTCFVIIPRKKRAIYSPKEPLSACFCIEETICFLWCRNWIFTRNLDECYSSEEWHCILWLSVTHFALVTYNNSKCNWTLEVKHVLTNKCCRRLWRQYPKLTRMTSFEIKGLQVRGIPAKILCFLLVSLLESHLLRSSVSA
jgi:hypothetical protein